MNKVKLNLIGISSAFDIMGKFQNAACKQGWTQNEVKQVFDEALKGDFDHILTTIMGYTESSDDGEDEEDFDVNLLLYTITQADEDDEDEI